MENKRKFIIRVYSDFKYKYYIKNIYGSLLGYSFSLAESKNKSKIWKFKKNCERALDKIQNQLDPTKNNLKKYKFEIIEITDKQVLRTLKLKKLNKV